MLLPNPTIKEASDAFRTKTDLNTSDSIQNIEKEAKDDGE